MLIFGMLFTLGLSHVNNVNNLWISYRFLLNFLNNIDILLSTYQNKFIIGDYYTIITKFTFDSGMSYVYGIAKDCLFFPQMDYSLDLTSPWKMMKNITRSSWTLPSIGKDILLWIYLMSFLSVFVLSAISCVLKYFEMEFGLPSEEVLLFFITKNVV